MRIQSRTDKNTGGGDMTPMIDMTFQLIAFFMVVINFTEAEQNERIKLPSSELAIPPDAPLESPVTLQLTREGTVLFGGDEMGVEALQSRLQRERTIMERLEESITDATVVIRADAAAKTGTVQELIRICQEVGFERFSLRAKNRNEEET